MQALSKVEHPTSPSSSNSNITPKSIKDLMQTITKLLEGGQESAQHLKIMFRNKRLGFKVEDDDHDHYHVIDHHSGVTLDAFETCLNMLRSYDFDHQEEKTIINKRKVDHVNDVQCSDNDHSSKSGDISDAKVSKERRGCSKRRRIGQSWTRTEEATSLMDDGYAWRKYGQKMILNTKYPRSYFRCTHKHDQDCRATKQVQQISENPVKYNIIYHGQHTCKNLHKTPSIVIDNSPLENSSFLLSFDTNSYSTPNNPSLFPPPTFLNSTMVNHDHDHDHHSGPHKQYSSSSTSDNYPPSSSDLTSTGLSSTPVSYDQSDVISQPGIYPSTSTLFDMDDDDLLSLINMEQNNLSQDLDGLF